MGNPVWRLFIAEQAEEWLEWLKNIHLNSYREMIQRFIYLNPNYFATFRYGNRRMDEFKHSRLPR